MKKIFIAITLLATLSIIAQKAKSKPVYAYTYSIPEWYITNEYSGYYGELNLSKDYIKIYEGKEHVANSYHKLRFNAFFNKKAYTNYFSTIPGLERVKDPFDYSGQMVKLVANVIDPRINIAINKKTSLKAEKPYSYGLSYSYKIELLVISDKTKKVLFRDVFKQNVSYYEQQNKAFSQKGAAINYILKTLPKSLIFTEMTKSLMKDLGGNYLKRKMLFLTNKNLFFYYFTLTKQRKYPLIKELNEFVSQFRTDMKKSNSNHYKEIKENSKVNYNIKNKLKDENTYQTPYEYGLPISYFGLVQGFVKNLNAIYKKTDINNKVQKKIAWVCMINSANAFNSIGDFQSASQYYEKAKQIDYNSKITELYSAKMNKKRNKLNIFYTEDNNLRTDINEIYLKALKTFKR